MGTQAFIDPESYLQRVPEKIADFPINRIQELLPWNLAATIPTHLPRTDQLSASVPNGSTEQPSVSGAILHGC